MNYYTILSQNHIPMNTKYTYIIFSLVACMATLFLHGQPQQAMNMPLVSGGMAPIFQAIQPETSAVPQDMEDVFDFWVGKWDASWDEGDGKMGKGTNTISKILDGKVLQEEFAITDGSQKGFKGTSISVYQPRLKRWKQAWADNQGGYFDFIGEFDNDNRIFKSISIQEDGSKLIQRMVFRNIEKNAFVWDWEASKDDGKSWKLLWQIHYTRVD